MGNGKRDGRQREILMFLKENGGASIREIASRLDVSDITVRRDLYELRDRGMIHYVSGVAIYHPEGRGAGKVPYELSDEKQINQEKKLRIGRYAASLLRPGDNIIIDTGSTTEQFARQIPGDLPMTALCYNVNIMNELLQRPQIKLLFAGGAYHRNTQMFESPEGLALINRTRATKVFLSAAGVSEQLGLTCMNQYEVEAKKAILDASVTRILLVDSAKFDVVRPAFFAPLSAVDEVVTDGDIPQDWIEILEQQNIRLNIAE